MTVFELGLDIIQLNIRTKFQAAEAKMRLLQDFPSIWPSDLVSDTIRPMFALDLDIFKTNILTKLQTAEAKIAAFGVLTRFSFNLT